MLWTLRRSVEIQLCVIASLDSAVLVENCLKSTAIPSVSPPVLFLEWQQRIMFEFLEIGGINVGLVL